MKKLLLILTSIAVLALASCEKEKTLAVDDPDTPTVSFYAEMRTRYSDSRFLYYFQDTIGSGEDEVAKDGMIYLVTEDVWKTILEQNYGGSWRATPVDSNYFDNENDLIAGFRDGRLSSIATIPATHGELRNIPYGEYKLIGALGLYYKDTLRTFKGSYLQLHIDESANDSSFVLKVVPNDNIYCFWQNSYWLD